MASSPHTDPEYLPFKIDLISGRVLWLRLNATQRRDAAFLDERALPPDAEGGWLPLDSLFAESDAVAPCAGGLFHLGHCGSTLLSRLLETWSEAQAIREPLPLRSLAEAWPVLHSPQSRLSPTRAPELLRSLWSRWSQPLPPATRTIVKATSSCNGLIAPLLEHVSPVRVIVLHQPLRPYLATVLKSPSSVLDAAAAAGERLGFLHARGYAEGVALHGLTLPEQCAMGWLAERVRSGMLAADPRVMRLDFESLLDDPEATLHAVARHLALDASGVAAALVSPAWRRYSKAQEHDYSYRDRAHDLALANERYGKEIGSGVDWVEAMAVRYPTLRAITEQ